MYQAKIICDSVFPSSDARITTFELTCPKMIVAEFNTHRRFSRNSASSRAIPIETVIKKIETNPVIPLFAKNQKGMQGDETFFSDKDIEIIKEQWLAARDAAVIEAKKLLNLGVHKQVVNRVLEPWMWTTILCTSTYYDNFFILRYNKNAQPEIRKLAELMYEQYINHMPDIKYQNNWHLPYIDSLTDREIDKYITAKRGSEIMPGINVYLNNNLNERDILKLAISSARCARVSYENQNQVRDISSDIELFTRLINGGHFSPLEHQAIYPDRYYESSVKDSMINKNGYGSENGLNGNFHEDLFQHRKLLPVYYGRHSDYDGHIDWAEASTDDIWWYNN